MLFGKGSKSSAEIGPQENVDVCDCVDDVGKQLLCSQAEMLPQELCKNIVDSGVPFSNYVLHSGLEKKCTIHVTHRNFRTIMVHSPSKDVRRIPSYITPISNTNNCPSGGA